MSATTPVAAAQRSLEPGRMAEHRFFTTYMLLLAAAVFLGFGPSFYLRGIMSPPGTLSPLRPEVIAHGLVAGAFMLLFPMQAWLIASGRRALHVRLGNWGFAIGVAMLPLGYVVAMTNYHANVAAAQAGLLPPGIPPAAIASAPLGDLLLLATLLWIAWGRRYDAQTHKRLMVAVACGLSDPGISRLPIPWGDGFAGVGIGHLAVFLTLAPLWAWDIASRRKLHWATLVGTLLLGGKLAGRLLIAFTPFWAQLVALLPGFGPP